MAGSTGSDIGGDKTEANRDTSGNTVDTWVVKIDSMGVKQWDKTYGGTRNDWLYTVDVVTNGYILGCRSASPIGADKSQDSWGTDPSAKDYWIIKIDTSGNKEWDRRYGGSSDDVFTNLAMTTDGGYLLGGTTSSLLADGDKTEISTGTILSWVVKIDSVGKKMWDKTIFTVGANSVFPDGRVAETEDGCYIVANCNNADTGGYKSQARWGIPTPYTNLWLVKLYMDSETGIADINGNGDLHIYPNPTTVKLTIQTSAASFSFQILSTDGRLLMQNSAKQQSNFEIDVSTLPAGLYFLQLWDGRQQVVKKFVKQ